ncbi:S8 family serine peptidase [Candidatus Poribacteria bacterium]|nr:S8 family serine peptidase [Candidatus Poribacteria bacterium]
MRLTVLAVALLLIGGVESRAATWLFLTDPPSERHLRDIERTGARVRTASRWFSAVSVDVEPSQVGRLTRLSFVAEVRPVGEITRRWSVDAARGAPILNAGSGDAQRRQIAADRLHEMGYTGRGVRVGMLDTGFLLTHEALADADVAATWDFVHGDEEVADEPGEDDAAEAWHGTQTFSVMAADLPGGLVGIAPEATFYLAKTEDVTLDGAFFESHIEEDYWVAGLEWCVGHGCRIVNSSLGYVLDYRFPNLDGATAIISAAADEAAARGTLVITAAGNTDGGRPLGDSLRGRISPPADAARALTVGGANSDGSAWLFSGRGPTFDGRVKPDVLAPAVGVSVVSPADDTSITSNRGTSFAAPLVAAAAALLLEAFADATPDELLTAFRTTASQADAPDAQHGYGLANAAAAYEQLAQRYTPAVVRRADSMTPVAWGALKASQRERP